MNPYDLIEHHVFDDIGLYPEELRRLLEDGLDPNIRNQYGESALMIASIKGSEDTVRLFLEYNADPNIVNEFYETVGDFRKGEMWKDHFVKGGLYGHGN